MTEREIFLAVLDLPDPAARAKFLDGVCSGDPTRRARIEALLLSHDTAGSFLGRPAVDPPAPDASATQEFSSAATPDDDGNKADDALTFLTPPGRPGSLGRIGHYEVLEVLGRGGFGIVFRAFDETLQRVVAIKVLAPSLAVTSPARKRFLREARSSAKVRHENVVQVYAVEEQPLPYLVMEFIPGETLQQRLNRIGPLETAEVVQFGRQIAEGLAAAHAQGLIHRDIKPANILIEAGPNQHVKITDFGLARAADDASLTQSGLVAGTPMYMAPEQASADTLDHRADLFSLGSVLYTMCSGRPPFRAPSTLAVLKRVAEDTPRPIPEIIPEVPQWLCDIIARLHAKKPEERIATAREVADLLGRGLAALQLQANVPPPAVEKTPPRDIPEAAPALRRPRFRARRWAAAAAVLLLLAAGGLGFTEATGVTNFHGSVIRLLSPEGTLEIAVDDPEVSVQIDGSDVVITGAGPKEIRLKTGSHTVKASKDGMVVKQELVTVTKDGKQVVRISQEALPSDAKVPIDDGKGPDSKTAKETTGWQGWPKAAPPPVIAPFDAAQAKKHQEAWARYLKVPVEYTNSLGMKFRLIPPGKFMMGSPPEEIARLLQEDLHPYPYYADRLESEGPEHEVEITQPFYMGVHEVTVSQFRQFVKNNNYQMSDDRWQNPGFEQTEDHPVVFVSWNNAVDFCEWLSKQQHVKKYRLPTEAEWEYSCRAGQARTRFGFGNEDADLGLYAWYVSNSDGKTHPVGQKKENAWGLYDMHGNVWQWCQDVYHEDYYSRSPKKDPPAPSGGGERVIRGGCLGSIPDDCRCAFRHHIDPHWRNDDLGFRAVLSVDAVKQAALEK